MASTSVQPAYIEQFDETDSTLSANQRNFNVESFQRLYGFPSLSEFKKLWTETMLADRWHVFMRRDKHRNPTELIAEWAESATLPIGQKPEVTMLPIDECAVCFRYCRTTETLLMLSRQMWQRYRVTDDYLSRIVHNGTVLLSVFFKPIFYPRFEPASPERLWKHYTPLEVKLAVGVPISGSGKFPVVLLGDNTEIGVQKSQALAMLRLTYSEKKHGNSLKLFLLVSPNGVVLDQAALRGGRAAEIACFEVALSGEADGRNSTFIRSVLSSPFTDSVYIYMDRGFPSTESVLRAAPDIRVPPNRLHVLLPHMLGKGKEHTPQEVIESLAVSLIRTQVEIAIGHSVKSAGAGNPQANNELLLEELRVEISIAVHNYNRMAALGIQAEIFETPTGWQREEAITAVARRAAKYVCQLYRVPVRERLTPELPPAMQPSPEVAALWPQCLASFPATWSQELEDHRADLFGKLRQPDHSKPWARLKPLPDGRARALVNASYVLGVTFREREGRFEVFARVHPSMYTDPYTTVVSWRSQQDDVALRGLCSCVAGNAGLCAHVQALCVVLAEARAGTRGIHWSEKDLPVDLKLNIPITRLLVQQWNNRQEHHAAGVPSATPKLPLLVSPTLSAADRTDAELIELARRPPPKLLVCFWCKYFETNAFTKRAVNHVTKEHNLAYISTVPEDVRIRLATRKEKEGDVAYILRPPNAPNAPNAPVAPAPAGPPPPQPPAPPPPQPPAGAAKQQQRRGRRHIQPQQEKPEGGQEQAAGEEQPAGVDRPNRRRVRVRRDADFVYDDIDT